LMEIKDKSQADELPSFDLSEVQVEDLSDTWDVEGGEEVIWSVDEVEGVVWDVNEEIFVVE
jgi:hypothetical protein